MKFSDLGLCEQVLRAVASEGYETPTPIQGQAIPLVMAGGDVCGCAQTGTGKTAAFALPILHRLATNRPAAGAGRKIRVLVLSPTRELASQIEESFCSYGRNTPLRTTVIFGGVNQNPQVKALRNGIDILVATPGRLLDLMNQGHVDLRFVETFVLDEADRMLDLGFFPDIRKIVARLPAQRQTLFFSATMPGDIRELANSILRNPSNVNVAPVSATADRIEQGVYHVAKRNKASLLEHLLINTQISRALVFTRTKRGADRVAQNLQKAGIQAAAIHGNKSQSQRERALNGFRMSRLPVLVATDIAARGIDVDAVSHVVNYDVPHEAETYVHRIGRTARAGASGIALSFCDHEERASLKAIERLIRQVIPVRTDHPEYTEGFGRDGEAKPQANGERSASRDKYREKRRGGAVGGRPQHTGGRPQRVPHQHEIAVAVEPEEAFGTGVEQEQRPQEAGRHEGQGGRPAHGGHQHQGQSGKRRGRPFWSQTQNRGGSGGRSRGRRRSRNRGRKVTA